MLFSELTELDEISSQFSIKRVFSQKEHDDIVLSMSSIMDIFICENPLLFSSPYFHNILEKHTIENIMTTLKFVYTDTHIHVSLEEEVKLAYNYTMTYYFKNDYPIRSFDDTFIRVEPNIENITRKIDHIKNKPQPTQQTNDWYLFRHNLITASSAWKIFKSQAGINEIIRDKCKPIDLTRYDSVNTNSPMHHGHKYEPISIMYYEEKYNSKVEDFGCIQHDTHKYLGASPDGIIVDKTSPLYGRMLEIKNPVSRQLTGIPKEDYWIQMQLQMETCNLNECDFLETVFKEYDDEDEFMNDGDFQYTENDQLKGTILYFIKNQKPHYEYAPLYSSKVEFEIWFDRIMEENSELTWVKNIYWRLEDISCVLVLRNKYWFHHAAPQIAIIWDIIEKERETGYEHRMPKKKKIKNNDNIEKTINITKTDKTDNTDIMNGLDKSICLIHNNIITSGDIDGSIDNIVTTILTDKPDKQDKQDKSDKQDKHDNMVIYIDTTETNIENDTSGNYITS